MSERVRKYRYSEIFGDTFQGEGHYTGIPTVWIRFWGCNFECNGFGQKNPRDQSTWELPYEKLEVEKYKTMEELPVFKYGCDSSYSWAKKFSHLAHQKSAAEICDELEKFLRNEHNPEGKFLHPKSGQYTHMAFTGGEPMMNQTAVVDIMLEFAKRKNVPKYVTVETNGTQELRKPFIEYVTGLFNVANIEDWDNNKAAQSFYMHGLIDMKAMNYIGLSDEEQDLRGKEWFWSVSPKLSLSGEKWEEAIRPDVLQVYKEVSNHGQLKYVVDGSQQVWDDVERATDMYRNVGINWPVWIMPVGADIEGQNLVAAKVSEEAVKRGYNVSARLHTYVFGNVIGK